MQLFYAPDVTLPLYTLNDEESKHCVRVLRLRQGDTLHLTDGRGSLHRCEIVEAHQHHCTVKIVETQTEYGKLPYSLTMAVAPTKNIDRYEWFLEKATEVGIDRIVPIECDHSERRTIKHEREERVITSAVKQSIKAYHPVLDAMTDVKELISAPFEGRKFIAHCDSSFEKRDYLPSIIKKTENILILIGPEGDFSPEEINFALENGFEAISLGNQRLRTETAAVAATVMVATINGM
ncbi:MAG: 16S rRNA (uracil(1498)-N(3))-methyltransferase [Alistipes sp.]|nr:16S rRNA (uracil(1498)-N(3))-methyltransferase [Alistipes sp.]